MSNIPGKRFNPSMNIQASPGSATKAYIQPQRFLGWSIIFNLVCLAVIYLYGESSLLSFWTIMYCLLGVANLIMAIGIRSLSIQADLWVVMLLLWIYPVRASRPDLVMLPLVAILWLVVGHQFSNRKGLLLMWLGPFIWWLAASWQQPIIWDWIFLTMILTSFALPGLYCLLRVQQPGTSCKLMDVILCSYSGNTAHFTREFLEGVAQEDCEVRVHRFHYYRRFKPIFKGDALVLSFPVFGCKPPWPLLNWLLFRLPSGHGKPVFIMYSCIGCAENAGLLCWLIFTLRGYRVIGRSMAMYPINVPTFRLGPRRLWLWLDRRFPRQLDLAPQYLYGRQFARGNMSGIPFVFGLTPAFLVGILLDNKFFDLMFYRNYAFHKRCNQCGLCVQYCPAERLRMVDGYPRAKGTCTLCMGCVNICPHGAMQLRFWTEYGRRYLPRFRRGVVISRESEKGWYPHIVNKNETSPDQADDLDKKGKANSTN